MIESEYRKKIDSEKFSDIYILNQRKIISEKERDYLEK